MSAVAKESDDNTKKVKSTSKKKVVAEKAKIKQVIKIRLKSFDHRLIDRSIRDIVDTVKTTGAVLKGPIPLPVKKERYDLLKSPHVNKDARDQFEFREHSRLLYILDPTEVTVSSLMKLDLPAGVDVQISVK